MRDVHDCPFILKCFSHSAFVFILWRVGNLQKTHNKNKDTSLHFTSHLTISTRRIFSASIIEFKVDYHIEVWNVSWHRTVAVDHDLSHGQLRMINSVAVWQLSPLALLQQPIQHVVVSERLQSVTVPLSNFPNWTENTRYKNRNLYRSLSRNFSLLERVFPMKVNSASCSYVSRKYFEHHSFSAGARSFFAPKPVENIEVCVENFRHKIRLLRMVRTWYCIDRRDDEVCGTFWAHKLRRQHGEHSRCSKTETDEISRTQKWSESTAEVLWGVCTWKHSYARTSNHTLPSWKKGGTRNVQDTSENRHINVLLHL